MKISRTQPLIDDFKWRALEAMFTSESVPQFELSITNLTQESTFVALPKYAQLSILSYKQGALDAVAKTHGRTISVSPRTVRRQLDVPQAVSVLQPNTTWHRHSNGAGWVSDTAHVDDSVFVSRTALVFGHAQVRGHVRLTGHVIVCDQAKVSDHARISGHALIRDMAVIYDSVVVNGHADVGGGVKLGGTIRIGGDTVLRGNVELGSERRYSERVPRGDVVLPQMAIG